jgi:septum formation protein
LLEAAGVTCTVIPADVDETPEPGETPSAHVRRLARAKALEVARSEPHAVILGADTVVVIDGHILGKPATSPTARAMLRRLSGRVHQVYTGVALWRDGDIRDAVDVTDVELCALSNEPDRPGTSPRASRPTKAGAYAIQGPRVPLRDPHQRLVQQRRRPAGGARLRLAGRGLCVKSRH